METTSEWDSLILKVAELLTTREKYQRILGQIAYEIANDYGSYALEDFANEVKETHGIHISPSTLRNYEFVYRKTASLKLPDDLSYRTLQWIASSGQSELWADRIKKEGLSSAEVYRLIRESKGLGKRKAYICVHCGKENVLESIQ